MVATRKRRNEYVIARCDACGTMVPEGSNPVIMGIHRFVCHALKNDVPLYRRATTAKRHHVKPKNTISDTYLRRAGEEYLKSIDAWGKLQNWGVAHDAFVAGCKYILNRK